MLEADTVTALAAPDVFYFGNAIGESGDTMVDDCDVAGAAGHAHDADAPAAISDPYDFNRDTPVDAAARPGTLNFRSGRGICWPPQSDSSQHVPLIDATPAQSDNLL